jgi:3-oxoacyl-[acyl-carrier-protein] synthase II
LTVAGTARPVVITGIGLIAPTGVGRTAFWEALCVPRPATTRPTRLSTAGFRCDVVGQVPDGGWKDLLEPRTRRTAAAATQLLLAAGVLALCDAQLEPEAVPPDRRGVSVGTALGGWRTAEEQLELLHARGPGRVNPFLASGAAPYGAGAALATLFGAQGPHATFASGCPASVQAIAYGAACVARNDVDVCLVGGVEWPLAEVVIAGMGRTHELCTTAGDPARASRPFDAAHAGIVLSEAACVLVLESGAHADRRGARAIAAVLGDGASCDARGLYGDAPDGAAGARAVHDALRRSGLGADDVGWVCAHANSSPAFDVKEALVLRAAFGDRVARLPVSSIKGVVGHAFGAAGALQAAAAALALAEATLPPTANLERPAAGCELHHVLGRARALQPEAVLVTSYGYGGVNACLVLGRAAEAR